MDVALHPRRVYRPLAPLLACALALAACAPSAGRAPAPSVAPAPPAVTPAPSAATSALPPVASAPPSWSDAAPDGGDRAPPVVRPDPAPPRPVPVPAVGSALAARRPEGAPDVVILGFSGHCGAFCRAGGTWSYLDAPGEGPDDAVEALQAVRDAFRDQGLEVHYAGFSSHVDTHVSPISGREEAGYLDAEAYLDSVARTWIEPYPDDPARVVLLAHSHGTVWASLLAMNRLDVTFDYLISLDAVCWQWWRLHRGPVRRAFAELGRPLPFPLDQGDPCGAFRIPGEARRRDVNDVVPANVVMGLEVRTRRRFDPLDPNLVNDDLADVRINGTKTNVLGIETELSHARVTRRAGDAVAWVGGVLRALGLPDHDDWSMEDAVLPPAPAGYRSR